MRFSSHDAEPGSDVYLMDNLGCTMGVQEQCVFFPGEDAPAKRQEAWII